MGRVIARFLGAGLVWKCLLLSPVWAEEWSPPSASEAYEESRRLVDVLMSGPFERRLREEFPEKVALLRSIEVTVDETPKIYGFANIEAGRRRIKLSSGIYQMVALYARYAAILNARELKINEKCNEYLKYLSDIYNLNKVKTYSAMNEFISDVETPDKFCDASGDLLSINRIHAEILDMTVVSVFAMMLGHEVAHHLLGHLPPKALNPSESKKREAEADRYGSILMGHIWRAPSAVVFTLLMNARQSHPFRVGKRYDAEECRFVFFIRDDIRVLGELDGLRILEMMSKRVDLNENAIKALKIIKENRNGSGNIDCDILQ